MVSVTRRSVMRATSGASTHSSPSSVRMTMPSKMCSLALSITRSTVPSWNVSLDTTGVPRCSAWYEIGSPCSVTLRCRGYDTSRSFPVSTS